MGLMTGTLERHRERLNKSAFEKIDIPPPAPKQSPMDLLKVCLEQYAGASTSLDKTASEADLTRLYDLHKAVEKGYRDCVKQGKRPEANVLLDKFAGLAYLKGQPGEAGDLHPFQVPGEK